MSGSAHEYVAVKEVDDGYDDNGQGKMLRPLGDMEGLKSDPDQCADRQNTDYIMSLSSVKTVRSGPEGFRADRNPSVGDFGVKLHSQQTGVALSTGAFTRWVQDC